jgi:hypothetical protein
MATPDCWARDAKKKHRSKATTEDLQSRRFIK